VTWEVWIRKTDRGAGGYQVFLRHDCGWLCRKGYAEVAHSTVYRCVPCDLRESFSLPSLPS